jgi:hypothetical protein
MYHGVSITEAVTWLDRCYTTGQWGEGGFHGPRLASAVAVMVSQAESVATPKELKVLAASLYIAAVEATSMRDGPTVITPALRDVLTSMSKRTVTDDTVEPLSKTLLYCITSTYGADMFVTSAVRDAFVTVAKHATSPVTVGYVSSGIGSLALNATPCSLGMVATAPVRDALVAMSRYATVPSTVQSLSAALTNVSLCGVSPFAHLFVTPSVVNALVGMSKFASTPVAVKFLAAAISNVASVVLSRVTSTTDALVAMVASGSTNTTTPMSRESHELHDVVANTHVRDAIVFMSSCATTPDAITHLAGAIYKICSCHSTSGPSSSSSLFVTEPIRDALIDMSSFATSSEAVRMLSMVTLRIAQTTTDAVSAAMFATADMMEACEAIKDYATTVDSRQAVESLATFLTRARINHDSNNNHNSSNQNNNDSKHAHSDQLVASSQPAATFRGAGEEDRAPQQKKKKKKHNATSLATASSAHVAAPALTVDLPARPPAPRTPTSSKASPPGAPAEASSVGAAAANRVVSSHMIASRIYDFCVSSPPPAFSTGTASQMNSSGKSVDVRQGDVRCPPHYFTSNLVLADKFVRGPIIGLHSFADDTIVIYANKSHDKAHHPNTTLPEVLTDLLNSAAPAEFKTVAMRHSLSIFR